MDPLGEMLDRLSRLRELFGHRQRLVAAAAAVLDAAAERRRR